MKLSVSVKYIGFRQLYRFQSNCLKPTYLPETERLPETEKLPETESIPIDPQEDAHYPHGKDFLFTEK